nr:hypothetical protein Iba_scaffold25514CG0010 [Ipomoea batatas]
MSAPPICWFVIYWKPPLEATTLVCDLHCPRLQPLEATTTGSDRRSPALPGTRRLEAIYTGINSDLPRAVSSLMGRFVRICQGQAFVFKIFNFQPGGCLCRELNS